MEHYLENLDRLSRSQIWELQKAYYMRQGMDAWNEGFLPSFMSSSAFVARTYADLIEGFIRDCNSDAPVTIVELGAGSGRLAFLILRSLFDRSIESNRYRYVMTDFTESNVNAWRETEVFQPFIDAGVLTFRVFDADSPEIMAGEKPWSWTRDRVSSLPIMWLTP